MKRHRLLWLLAAGLLLTSSRAAAWNGIGHMASAKLAYDQFEDSQRAELFALLQKHPHFDQFLAAGCPPDVDRREWATVRAAVWPDWVRPRRADPRGPGVGKYHRGEEHYVNIPLVDPNDTAAFAGKTLIAADKTDILCALKQRCNDLHIRNSAPEDKAVAICWIFHLVGDVHQPLHNVAYFSSEAGLRQGDQGGNKFVVKINGRVWKLHAFWDDLLGEDPDYLDDSAEHQRKVYGEAMKVADRLRRFPLAAADQEKLAKNLSFASWSAESFELAKTVCYQKGDGSGILGHANIKPGRAVPDDAPEAGAEYAEVARATAEVRIVLAGRRLADRIKALLAAGP
jgi:hypothetical protein